MKKLGFTLAEILVTMGVIGVVAAMTAPVLMTNVKNQSYATKLRTTVGDLENAFSMAIAAEKAEDLWGTSLLANGGVGSNFSIDVRNNFYNSLARYLKMTTMNDYDASLYYQNHNTTFHEMNRDGGVGIEQTIPAGNRMIPITLKNGSVIFIVVYNPGNDRRTGAIFIDVNAADGPNTYGRDVFGFNLAEDGVLFPIGGHNEFGFTPWDDVMGCPRNGGIRQGISCTGRLVENNYQFDY